MDSVEVRVERFMAISALYIFLVCIHKIMRLVKIVYEVDLYLIKSQVIVWMIYLALTFEN